jgi:virginiamycin A acetyltransferase
MRRTVKTAALWCATLATMLPAALCRLMVRFSGDHDGFFGWSEAMSLLPGQFGNLLRRSFYHSTLVECHAEHVISFGTVLTSRRTRIGSNVFVGRNCVLGAVTIEQDALIASQVSIINGLNQHRFDRLDLPIREQEGVYEHITIGRDSWIGERAVICADVGRHCVIGAGSVVTQPIPDYAVAVGSPAKVIRYREQPRNTSQAVQQAEPAVPVLSEY